ncbi:MAG: hypothetical protein Q9217_004820 [Psora testacea]
MPLPIHSQQYGEVILDHVRMGVCTVPEDVVSSELPPSALPKVSTLIKQAREDVKKNIRSLSAESAPDIDGWITQAKQLRDDISKSHGEAQGIVEQAGYGKSLEEGVADAAGKVRLLESELLFNNSLEVTLERLQALRSQLDQIQRAVVENNLPTAVELIGSVGDDIASLTPSPNSRVAAAFSSNRADLRSDVTQKLTNCWMAYLHIDRDQPSIRIREGLDGSFVLDLDSTAEAMKKLGILDDVLLPFCKDVEALIILPRLHVQGEGTADSFVIEDDKISSAGPSSDLSAEALFSDLQALIEFFRHRLPSSVVDPLSRQLMPRLINRLISTWLASAVPDDLDGMKDFQNTLILVQTFGNMLDACAWPGNADLVEWANDIPDIWLRKYQENSLNRIRKLLFSGLESTELVERVETQVISRKDDVFASNGGGENWDAGWSDEEERLRAETLHAVTTNSHEGADNEEDVSAWGLDDEKENVDVLGENLISDAANEDAEAWGWGDENEEESPIAMEPATAAGARANTLPTNGVPKSTRPADRQVTLRETYTITSLTKEVLSLVHRVISDSAALESAEYANLAIAKSSSSLPPLPGLALAMYRAGSFSAYTAHSSGNMFIYNDSLWLAEQLQKLPSQTTTSSGKGVQSRFASSFKFPTHISALDSHGKRAYAREMESQRTVITDLLDGAQGFMHCTEHPFNQECDIAIASTIDRLRHLQREWETVLSHSALLQSLGSLLSTACSKIILDIEDISDISEAESQQLTCYCTRIAALEDLFTPQQSEPTAAPNEETLSLTAVYAPAWLKFQYLMNILESSLVDIKYLWTEGELSLYFQTEELVDLIVALFADSTHRRGAISEIRASKR